jgi:hypothetical protein
MDGLVDGWIGGWMEWWVDSSVLQGPVAEERLAQGAVGAQLAGPQRADPPRWFAGFDWIGRGRERKVTPIGAIAILLLGRKDL